MVVGKAPGRFRHRGESDDNCFKNQVDADHPGDGKKWMDAQVRRTFFPGKRERRLISHLIGIKMYLVAYFGLKW